MNNLRIRSEQRSSPAVTARERGTRGTREHPVFASPAFAIALAAVADVNEHALGSAAFRMALRTALVRCEQALVVEVAGSRRGALAGLVATLERNLAVDWPHVGIIELRYRDDSTEVVNVRMDPDATAKFERASAFRVVSAR